MNVPVTAPPPSVPLTDPARITLTGTADHATTPIPIPVQACNHAGPFNVGLAAMIAAVTNWGVTAIYPTRKVRQPTLPEDASGRPVRLSRQPSVSTPPGVLPVALIWTNGACTLTRANDFIVAVAVPDTVAVPFVASSLAVPRLETTEAVERFAVTELLRPRSPVERFTP